MNLKFIIDCLNENGINYPKDFATIERDGWISDFDSLMKDNLAKIEKVIKFGVNNGFNGDLKNDILDLIKLTVKITKEKQGKKLSKFEKESIKIIKDMERNMKNKDVQPAMVKEVIKYVDVYIKGMEVMLILPVAETRKSILTKGIEKLATLKGILSEVADESTTTALDMAKSIIGELNDWADIVARKMHSEASLAILDKAIGHAEEWKKLHKAVNTGIFKKSNKVKDIKEIEFIEDDLTMISKSQDIIRDINIFSENLKEYKDMVKENTLNSEHDQKMLDEKKAKKEELLKKKNDLIVKFKNGEISKSECYDECILIDEDVQYLNEDIKDIQISIEEKKHRRRAIDNVIENLEKLNKKILEFQADPIYMSLIGEYVDFSILTRVMRGAGTTEDINYVLDIENIINKINKVRIDMETDFNANIKNLRNKRRQQWLEERTKRNEARVEVETKNKAKSEQEMDDYFKSMNINVEPERNENTNTGNVNKADENITIALSDEDK